MASKPLPKDCLTLRVAPTVYHPEWEKCGGRWEARIGPFILIAERLDGYWKGNVAVNNCHKALVDHMSRVCGIATKRYRRPEKAKAEAVEKCGKLLVQLQADLKELTP
jgi:hypothetical protein